MYNWAKMEKGIFVTKKAALLVASFGEGGGKALGKMVREIGEQIFDFDIWAICTREETREIMIRTHTEGYRGGKSFAELIPNSNDVYLYAEGVDSRSKK